MRAVSRSEVLTARCSVLSHSIGSWMLDVGRSSSRLLELPPPAQSMLAQLEYFETHFRRLTSPRIENERRVFGVIHRQARKDEYRLTIRNYHRHFRAEHVLE